MDQFLWTTLVTLMGVLLYFVMGLAVGRARLKYKVAAPATTGDPNFERCFRVQMNTLEWMVIFLPALWLFAFMHGDQVAAGIGAIWVLGRLLYMVLYVQDPKKRAFGYALQGLAGLALLIGALVGVVTRLLAAPMA